MAAKNHAKNKNSKSKASEVPDPQLPGLVEAMAKLVERLEGLERKVDTILSRVSNPPQVSRPHSPQPQAMEYNRSEGRAERKMYQAVCADCRKSCEVPFKPTDRPVYCKECFTIHKAGHTPQDPNRRRNLASYAQKSPYVPSALSPQGISTLPGRVTVFEKRRTSQKHASAKTKKRR